MKRDEQLLMADRLSERTKHPANELLEYIEWWDNKGVPNIEYQLRMCIRRYDLSKRCPLWREFAEVDWCYKEPHMHNINEMHAKEWFADVDRKKNQII